MCSNFFFFALVVISDITGGFFLYNYDVLSWLIIAILTIGLSVIPQCDNY